MRRVTKFESFMLEVRSVVKFLTKEGFKFTEIKRLDNIYRDFSPSFTAVKERSKLSRLKRNSIIDYARQGSPVEVTTRKKKKMKFTDEMVLGDRHLKAKEKA
jgi:hypothetical protein